MSEVKVKLFGKTIELPDNTAAVRVAEAGGPELGPPRSCEDGPNQDPPCTSDSVMLEDSSSLNRDAEEQESQKQSLSSPKHDHSKDEEDHPKPSTSDERKNSNATPPITEDSNTPNSTDSNDVKTSKMEEDESNEKTLKKPDKILPCPRCSSMDTKFCYFNNYNVNQPRHFCKNCQRYWTAGGTMRNVPVGAGRRKNKNSISQFRHLVEARVADLPNGLHHHPALNPNGTVLAFGSDLPLCESMASVLNIVEKTGQTGSINGFHNPVVSKEIINGDDASNSNVEEGGKSVLHESVPNCHQFPPQVPCYPAPPWHYPWNPMQWSAPPVSTPPTFGHANFPMPFYSTPPPYWGWNVPWIVPPPTATVSSQSHHTPPNSPTLGKHLRDDNVLKLSDTKEEEEKVKETKSEKSLWVPKTLRIDDPGEAAKNSIWATLGIKNDRADSIGGNGLFKAFQSKGGEKNHVLEASTVLQANPAALSRSVSFHERS